MSNPSWRIEDEVDAIMREAQEAHTDGLTVIDPERFDADSAKPHNQPCLSNGQPVPVLLETGMGRVIVAGLSILILAIVGIAFVIL